MRKLTSLIVALIVTAGVMASAPATAATPISNGVACTKLGAVKLVSGSKYKCATNPLLTSTKRIWLLTVCLDAVAFYQKSKALLPAVKASSDSSIAEIDINLKKTQADLTEFIANGPSKIAALQVKVTDAGAKQADARVRLAAARVRLADAIAKHAAPTTTPVNRAKYQIAIQQSELAIKQSELAIKQWELAIKRYENAIVSLGPVGRTKIEKAITRLTTSKSLAEGVYLNVRADVNDALGSAKLICTKGL